MAKLKDDEIKWVLSLNSSQAQQEIGKLNNANKQLSQGNKDLRRAMLDLEAQGKKNSTEYKNLQKSLEQNNAAIDANKLKVKELEKTMGLTDLTMGQLKKRASELQRQLDNTSLSTNPEQYKKLDKELNQVRGRMAELRTSGKSMTDQLGMIPGPVGMVTNSVKGLSAGLKLLLANPVFATIAIIVAGLMLLYKAFKSTDSGATALAGVFKGLGNVMDVLLDRVSSFSKMLVSLFTFDWEGLKQNGKKTFDGLASSIRDAALAGYEYEQVMDSIKDREAASLIRQAKLRVEIEKLRNVAKDQTKSYEERLKASDAALKKEEELMNIEKQYRKERLDAEINNAASMIQTTGLTIEQKRKQVREWLKLDDRQLAGWLQNNKRFGEFYDNNEELFQNLQKLKAEDIQKDADYQREIRRLLSEGTGFRKQLMTEENKSKEESLKKQLESEKKQLEERKKIISDTSILVDNETIFYRERLKKAGLFGVETNKLTRSQLEEKEKIESEYQQKLTQISIDAENERFRLSLKAAGLDGDVKKMEGEKLVAYERLLNQHENNIQKIRDDASLNAIKSQKETEAAILQSMKLAYDSQIQIADTVESARLTRLKSDLANRKITQQQYEADVLKIESDALAERLVAQESYVATLKAITSPSEEQKKALLEAEKALQQTQNQIYDQKINKEIDFQEKRKALLQQYGLITTADAYALEMAALDKSHADGLLREEEYERAKLLIKIKAAQQYTQRISEIVSAGSSFVQSLQQSETTEIQADYEKRLSSLNQSDEDYAEKKKQLEYKRQVDELEVQKKYADAQFGIQVAQIGVATATGIMNAWASSMTIPPPFGEIMAGIMTGILVGTGIAQVAAANKERQKIKSMTIESPSTGGGSISRGAVVPTGYADGGYTGDGGKYEVAGYLPNGQPFHRGEYFIAQEEMSNPKLIPFVRRIDQVRAERVGSRSLPEAYGSGYADGGYSAGTSRDAGAEMLMAQTVVEFRRAVEKFASTKFNCEINYWEFKDTEEMIDKSQNLGKRAS